MEKTYDRSTLRVNPTVKQQAEDVTEAARHPDGNRH